MMFRTCSLEGGVGACDPCVCLLGRDKPSDWAFLFLLGVDWFGTLNMYGGRESLCLDAMGFLGTVGGDVGMLVDGTGRLEWG